MTVSYEVRAQGMRRDELQKAYVAAMNRLDQIAEQDEAVAQVNRVFEWITSLECMGGMMNLAVAGEARRIIEGTEKP